MASAELDRFSFCPFEPDEADGPEDVANLSAFRERLMLAARPRMVYRGDPLSSDAKSIDCVEPDWELGKAGAGGVDGRPDVRAELSAIASEWCDCISASLCTFAEFNIAELTTVLRGESLVGGCRREESVDGAATFVCGDAACRPGVEITGTEECHSCV
jgi:hypothetical protein